jgi:hypothetical protein
MVETNADCLLAANPATVRFESDRAGGAPDTCGAAGVPGSLVRRRPATNDPAPG